MRRRPEGQIGIADLVVALAQLDAGPADSQRIAAMLGFSLHSDPTPSAAKVGDTVQETSATEHDVADLRPDPALTHAPPRQTEPVVKRRPGASHWSTRLTPVGKELETLRSSVSAALGTGPAVAPEIEFLPLISPRYTARVVQAAASTDAGDGELDVEAVVDLLARRAPVTDWPLMASPSLLRGVQILVDIGESMTLFARDCVHLCDVIHATVGQHLVAETYFVGSPWRGTGAGTRGSWAPYAPPPPGTPVLILTDLDIPGRDSDGTDTEGWIALRDLLLSRGSAMTVLVPFPRHRWPSELAVRLPIVEWDRSTSAASVLSAIGASR